MTLLSSLALTGQPSDATLTAIAGLTTGADLLPYFTGTDAASTTALTPFMRTLLDDADANTAKTTLGISSGGATLSSNTFTGNQTISSAAPSLIFKETDQTTNEKGWSFNLESKTFSLSTLDDSDNVNYNVFSIVRGSGAVVSLLSYGNNNNFPNHTFHGKIGLGGYITGSVFTIDSNTAKLVEASQYDIYINTTHGTAATTLIAGLTVDMKGEFGTYTTSDVFGVRVLNFNKATNQNVTIQTGLSVEDLSNGDTSYGLRLKTSSGSGKWNLFIDGTAKNHVKGRLILGATGDDGANQLQITGSMTVSSGSVYKVNDVQVLSDRKTGWSAATGTATRTSFSTTTVLLSELAERVKALIDDLISHGAIGA